MGSIGLRSPVDEQREMVDLPHASGAARLGVNLALTTQHALATAPTASSRRRIRTGP